MTASIFSTKVLVTGPTDLLGYIQLCDYCNSVITFVPQYVMKPTKKNVTETLSKYSATDKLEFALVDLSKDEGWKDAIQGCNYVLHIASPFPAENPKDENELVIPARDGTLRVFQFAAEEGVKRVVMLSTVAAVSAGHEGENRTFDETDWSDLKKTRFIYPKSKTLAEGAAWDFIRSAKNKSKMEMVAINPSNVFGPVLDGHHHTSTEWFRTIMHAEVPGVARTQLDLVDVRDLVEVLVKAITLPDAADKRFICNGASIPLIEFADILHENFSKRGFRIPNRTLPDFVVRAIALFIPKVRTVAGQLKWKYTFSSEQARLVFGWQPRPYQQTIVDMAESLITFGVV